jgi:hypothetical protein
MSVTVEAILCGGCSAQLKDALPSAAVEARIPCPSCGSTTRIYHAFIVESIKARDGLGMKAKRPGEKRPYVESKNVPHYSHSRAKLVHREQLLDRDNDRYFERVTDYETGAIIHECDEPLSQHIGHGSDTKNRKP